MNRKQIIDVFNILKVQLMKSGKKTVIPEDKITKCCEYTDVINEIFKEANVELNLEGGYKYDNDEERLIFFLIPIGNPEDVGGSIKFYQNGNISIDYFDGAGLSFALSLIKYDGRYTTGTIIKVIDTENFATTSIKIEEDCYKVSGEKVPYESEDELGKIKEVFGALEEQVKEKKSNKVK